ncbi:MAG: transcriptional regulator [Chloroflexota bacterium]|nr:transcriptional regulator [Chloroflexota bacterium]MDE2960278.1 transcriptional regulator [Chloroflexota bacterium]
MANIPHIANEEDYNLALARMDEIFHAAIGTREGDERDLLFDLIEAYEERHHPVNLPSVPAAIEFHMEQLGLTPGDLAPLLGSQKVATAVLSGKMDITIAMARALHKHWGIPAEVLLQEPSDNIKRGITEPAIL